MGRLLRLAAPGLAGLGMAVAAYSVFWLYTDYQRNRELAPPVPILVGKYVTRP